MASIRLYYESIQANKLAHQQGCDSDSPPIQVIPETIERRLRDLNKQLQNSSNPQRSLDLSVYGIAEKVIDKLMTLNARSEANEPIRQSMGLSNAEGTDPNKMTKGNLVNEQHVHGISNGCGEKCITSTTIPSNPPELDRKRNRARRAITKLKNLHTNHAEKRRQKQAGEYYEAGARSPSYQSNLSERPDSETKSIGQSTAVDEGWDVKGALSPTCESIQQEQFQWPGVPDQLALSDRLSVLKTQIKNVKDHFEEVTQLLREELKAKLEGQISTLSHPEQRTSEGTSSAMKNNAMMLPAENFELQQLAEIFNRQFATRGYFKEPGFN